MSVSSIRRALLLPAATALILTALGVVSWAAAPMIRRARPPEFVAQEMIYFPSGRFLAQTSAGQSELLADLLWLRAIQYYGAHRQSDRQYVWARHIFRVITALNPRFVEAYRFGALVLVNDAMQPQDGFDLLKRGMHANPSRWELPFDLGFLYFLHHDDLLAATYFQRAGGYPAATDRVSRFAAFAFRRGGRDENARALWTELRNTATNPASREIAEYAIRSIALDAAIDSIETAVEAYRAMRGGVPRTLADVVARGYLKTIPSDPFGGGFLIDPASGAVHSLFRVRETLEQTLTSVKQTVLLFRQQEGEFPGSLEDLLARGYMTAIRLPEGFSLRYDAGTGAVAPVVPAFFARAFPGKA